MVQESQFNTYASPNGGMRGYCQMIDEDDAVGFSADAPTPVCAACHGRGWIPIERFSSSGYACTDCRGPKEEEMSHYELEETKSDG